MNATLYPQTTPVSVATTCFGPPALLSPPMAADLHFLPTYIQQQLLQAAQQVYQGLQDALNSQRAQAARSFAMQQWVAAASCAASLVVLLATIAAGERPLCVLLPAVT